MLKQLEGAFAIAIIFKNLNLLAGSRKEVHCIGISDDSTFIGSDSVALAPFTKKIIFMEEGDSVIIEKNAFKFLTKNLESKEKLPYLVIQIKVLT